MFLLKSKYPEYYSYKGRKISKKISISKKNLVNKFYNQISLDREIIRNHESAYISKKISLPTNFNKINIEIGFGNGEFLIKNALSYPDELFIGIEVYLNGIAKVLATILNLKLKNIILSNLNCFYFLNAMPIKSVDKIFIINPDPWIKKRHNKRRLMSFKIIQLLRSIIKSKHSIYMTTDSKNYLEDTRDLLDEYRENFGEYNVGIMSKNDKLYGISKYQRKAIEKGEKIYLLTF